MFILLATTAAEGSKLKFAVALIIALLVAAGAGVRTLNSLKNKKFESSSLEGIANSIFKDPELSGLLKSVITDKCFQDSNNYEEFIHNVHTEATVFIESYINKNISYIPEVLRPFITVENMAEITEILLGLVGIDGKELTDMFEKYLEDLLTTEEEVEDDVQEELIEETVEEEVTYSEPVAIDEVVEEEVTDAEPVVETDEVAETTPATVEVETIEVPTVYPILEETVEEEVTTESVVETDEVAETTPATVEVEQNMTVDTLDGIHYTEMDGVDTSETVEYVYDSGEASENIQVEAADESTIGYVDEPFTTVPTAQESKVEE